VIRTAVGRAMREMGRQFVLGETIEAAIRRPRDGGEEGLSLFLRHAGRGGAHGGGRAALPQGLYARRSRPRPAAKGGDIRTNPGISVKLSALHPRYEEAGTMLPVMVELCRRSPMRRMARAGMGSMSTPRRPTGSASLLDVIEKVLADPTRLPAGTGSASSCRPTGRARPSIDWLHALAEKLDRRIMVRLVKGAYWDTEIKRAQVMGLAGFPVFTARPTPTSPTSPARASFSA
jgi:RHH-type transcriptional regulator, proline utilization regulon repressor / proline dehydrogenase / delta 1-pyrroline-5-carboxylate dehydrogenase